GIGFVFGDMSGALDKVFLVAESLFPKMTSEFLFTIKELVRTALFGSVKLTLINFVFLLIGSLSFVNSLWTGVYLLTMDRTFLSWRNYVRGVVLLGVSSLFVVALFLIPSMFVSLVNFIKNSFIVTSVLETLPMPREIFLDIAVFNIDRGFLLKSDFFAL